MFGDLRDPVYKNTGGETAIRALVHRHQRWAAGQPASVTRLFCEHGTYVGHARVFADGCPLCVSGGELSPASAPPA